MKLANQHTTVAASKSVAEIQSMLARAGAKALMIEYTPSGEPSALAFKLACGGRDFNFRLPCNLEGVLRVLRKEAAPRFHSQKHARNVGWRIMREWLRAQLSLIAAGAVQFEEVMLPWAITPSGETVAQQLLSGSSGLLGLPEPPRGDE